ncbi:MAG: Na+/H+ antiporter subunit E [Micrococcaceae bacterium]|nr:Na+/H+ antiporter subunit E [Micrococcaceae bacterium]
MSDPHPSGPGEPARSGQDDGTVHLRPGAASPLSWPLRLAAFTLWYAWALATSSGAVLKDLLTRGRDAAPGIARVHTNCTSDAEVTLLSALVTLTPGTLTLGTNRVADPEGLPGAGRLLYVHGLYAQDADALRAEIHDMERRMLHAVRKRGVA